MPSTRPTTHRSSLPDGPGSLTSRAALVAVAAAAVLFGTSGVARGLGPDGLSTTFVASWRAVVGGAALMVVARPTLPRGWVDVGWSAAGGVAVVGYQLAFFAAADRVGVGPAAVVTIGTGPAVAGLLDAAFGRRPSARWLTGVAVAVAGIVLLTTGTVAGGPATGWALAVLAGSCFPIYGFAAQRLMAHRRPLAAIATVFGAGAVLALPIGLVGSADSAVRAASEVGTLGLILYLGLVATALAYGLWALGLRHLSLSDTVAVTLAEPAAAVVLSAVLLDEALGPRTIVAMVLVVVGVAVATISPGGGAARAT